MAEPLELSTADGVSIEAEVEHPPHGTEPRGGMVLCHPHPEYGGTMRSIVISALFEALPPVGVTCLRFNFRGVEGSGGLHDRGDAERLDVRAALPALHDMLPARAPLVLAGWSFGADVALSVHDPAIDAWYAIACPLSSVRDLASLAADPRPKLVALAEHDELRPPGTVAEELSRWRNVTVEIVGGASHYFVGRTGRLVDLGLGLVDRLAQPEGPA